MGGSGSGNFYHHHRPTKKPVVEDCLSLDVADWQRCGTLRAGGAYSGTTRWTYPGGNTFAVSYEIHAHDPERAAAVLSYRWVWTSSGQADSACYAVRLTATALHRGGCRWWFVCPLVINGVPCGRRAGKLYLPPSARYFGCRTCHGLTYTSCQESGRHEGLYRAIAAQMGCDAADVRRSLNRIGKGRDRLA
jgi:hypothetical protein